MGFFSMLFGKRKKVDSPESKAKAEAVEAMARTHLENAIKTLEEKNKKTSAHLDFLKEQERLALERARIAGEKADEARKEVKGWDNVLSKVDSIEKERAEGKVVADRKIKDADGPLKIWIEKHNGSPSRDLRVLLDPGKVSESAQLEAIRLILLSRKEPPLPINPLVEAFENSINPKS